MKEWRERKSPSSADFAFARELAYGVIRMRLALDHLGRQLAARKKLNLKAKERLLLHMGIYQKIYMERVADHAVVYETVELAKTLCNASFVRFLNAALRQLIRTPPSLPQGSRIQALASRYSYPPFFIEQLIADYGREPVEGILEAGNSPAQTTFRIRKQASPAIFHTPGIGILAEGPVPIALLEDPALLPKIAASADYYLQNGTPALLMSALAEGMVPPRRLLDLCAAPGGKLLLLHDLFPEAELFANDRSEKRLELLRENCQKYQIEAKVSCLPGEDYPATTLFDLIVLDVPCSNSGVFNKRPEARWRLCQKTLALHRELQGQLLRAAARLLREGGEIWYLTCSILKEENQRCIEVLSKELGLQVRKQETLLPSKEGWDGGYGCALQTRF